MMPHPRIEIDPSIMDGKPVIRGTRIPVELVLRKLGHDEKRANRTPRRSAFPCARRCGTVF